MERKRRSFVNALRELYFSKCILDVWHTRGQVCHREPWILRQPSEQSGTTLSFKAILEIAHHGIAMITAPVRNFKWRDKCKYWFMCRWKNECSLLAAVFVVAAAVAQGVLRSPQKRLRGDYNERSGFSITCGKLRDRDLHLVLQIWTIRKQSEQPGLFPIAQKILVYHSNIIERKNTPLD